MIVVSDIHFGSGWGAEAVADAVISAALRSPSRALIISGDLTQNARGPEYSAAGAFIRAALERGLRIVCTPGNHDFGRWQGEKLRNERARNLYTEHVRALLTAQGCTVAANDYDTISEIGDDVFVALRSTHAHLLRPNRIRRKQIEWAVSTIRAHALHGRRLHLVTHRSLWQDAADKHPDMHRRLRLEQQLLSPLPFRTFIHGHNHRFVFQQKRTPKLNLCIQRLAAPTLSSRDRGRPTGFVEWDPATQQTTFVEWKPAKS